MKIISWILIYFGFLWELHGSTIITKACPLECICLSQTEVSLSLLSLFLKYFVSCVFMRMERQNLSSTKETLGNNIIYLMFSQLQYELKQIELSQYCNYI